MSISISTRFIERRFELRGDTFGTTAIINQITGQSFAVEPDEFLLEIDPTPQRRRDFGMEGGFGTVSRPHPTYKILTNQDFAVTTHRIEDDGDGGQVLRVELENTLHGLVLEIFYELARDQTFVRKHLVVRRSSAADELYITRIEVERFRFASRPAFDQPSFHIHPQSSYTSWYGEPTLGQPLLGDQLFMGLEFPAGYNRYEDGLVSLRHFPGRRIDVPVTSKSAVIGVAEPGKTCAAFRQYLMSVVTPSVKARRTIMGFSTWSETNTEAHESACLNHIDMFRENLTEKNGFSLDYYEIDYGWADPRTLWEPDPRKFPNGLEPLIARLGPMRFGLWFNPTGASDVKVGPESGFEPMVGPGSDGAYATHSGYCPAAPTYGQAAKKRLIEVVQRYNLRLVIFDFFVGRCEADDHGHLPGRPYALEAIFDAMQDWTDALRQVQPDVFIVNWEAACYAYSPWLLMQVDTIWMGFSDSPVATAVPSPLPQTPACITARDDMTFTETLSLTSDGKFDPAPFPQYAIDKFFFWDTHESDLERGLPRYYGLRSDNLIMGACRGYCFRQMWMLPRLYTEKDWQFIASVGKWVQANDEILLDMKPLFGDPINRRVYAYGHYQRSVHRGIVAVRNPFIEQQTAKIHLNAELGMEPHDSRSFVVRTIYPYTACLNRTFRYGDCVRVPVEAYQALVLEIIPAEHLDEPVVLGARYEIDQSQIRVWGHPGHEQALNLLMPNGQTQSTQVSLPGPRQDVLLRSAAIVSRGRVGTLDMHLPESLVDPYLLVLFEAEDPEPIYCEMRHYDDQTGPWMMPVTHRSPLDPIFQGYAHNRPHPIYWTFFLCPLGTGDHRIEFEIKTIPEFRQKPHQHRSVNAKPVIGTVSAWLWCEQPLVSTSVDIPVQSDIERAPRPCPMAGDIDLRALCLIEPIHVNPEAYPDDFVWRR